jgi:hypothetical protein
MFPAKLARARGHGAMTTTCPFVSIPFPSVT